MFRCAVFLVLLALPLRANLGENVKQIVARYGTPTGYTEASAQSPFGTLRFAATGYVLVIFLNGETEVGAWVSKSDKSSLSDAEQKNIMDQDLNGSQWISSPSNDPNELHWTRSDNATVIYDKKKNILIFATPEMNKILQATPAVPPASPSATNAPAAVPPPAAK
jgi:hypothetical protein